MRKSFTKIICLTVGLIAALCITLVSACTNKVTPLEGNIFTDAEAVSNGGFAVEKGDYIYFINGVESNTADNTFGDVVKGAVMRISKSDFSARNYSSVDTVVPQIAYSGNSNAGIFIYGDYIYYATPSTEKTSDGEVQNSYLAFKSTKLDGTGTTKSYFFQSSSNSVEYRYVEVDGVVYLVYVATGEDLFKTDASYTNLHSVNTATGEDTLLAYNVENVIFDRYDLTNPRIYYTMTVTDFVTRKSYSDKYNQLYTVTADETVRNEYNFDDVDDYDADKDPLYINCGTLVLDGIGKIDAAAGEGVTQFNAAGAEEVSHSSYKYSVVGYENGSIFYTRSDSYGSTASLYKVDESTLLSESHSALDQAADGDYLIYDGSSASSYYYIYGDNGNIEWVLIPDSTGIVKARFVDGKISEANGDDYSDRFYMTKTGTATLLFTETHNGINYIYYSLSGGNGYTVYRISYDGNYGQYNKLDLSGEASEYKEVRILDLDSASSWYKPEMFYGQIIFASETTNMTDYNYLMVCDLRGESSVMTNVQIKELNELYESVSEAIDDVDDTVYENLPNALRYAFYTGDADYIDTLIKAYVDIKGYSETYYWSEESVARFKAFVAAEDDGEWKEFSASVTVNGETVKANRRDYYYSLLGVMSDDDAEAYDKLIKTNYLKEYPETDETWFESLSTGAKVGFIIGVCAGGLIVIAAVVVVTLVIVRKRKEKLPTYKKKRIKVDTTDDKNIDVYATEDGE